MKYLKRFGINESIQKNNTKIKSLTEKELKELDMLKYIHKHKPNRLSVKGEERLKYLKKFEDVYYDKK